MSFSSMNVSMSPVSVFCKKVYMSLSSTSISPCVCIYKTLSEFIFYKYISFCLCETLSEFLFYEYLSQCLFKALFELLFYEYLTVSLNKTLYEFSLLQRYLHVYVLYMSFSSKNTSLTAKIN